MEGRGGGGSGGGDGGRDGGRYGSREGDGDRQLVRDDRDRSRDGGGGDDRDSDNRAVSMVEGGEFGAGGLPGGTVGRGCHLEGGVTDPQRERGLPRHWPSGGGVEGSGGDYQLPVHNLNHLSRRPPWLPSGLFYRY